MQFLKHANALITFLLELAMLASLAYWANQQVSLPAPIKLLLSILAPLVAAVLWGILAAPKSRHRLPFKTRLVFQLTMFLVSFRLLYLSGQFNLAVLLAIFACLSAVAQLVTTGSSSL